MEVLVERSCKVLPQLNGFFWLFTSFIGLLASSINAQPNFEEVALDNGLVFTHISGRTGEMWTLEITGAGVGLLDYDNDGLLDVYAVQGGPIRDRTGELPHDQLFRNVSKKGKLEFEDVSRETGIADIAISYGMGIATGDIDNDGDSDILVLNFGANQLLENRNGRFFDITEDAGIHGEDWSISASFADVNRDGLLDLYIANYLVFPPLDQYEPCHRISTRLSYCAPSNFPAAADQLYLNRGGGVFEDISQSSAIGLVEKPGMGVVITDLSGDGLIDIYVANDASENFLWLNQGDGTFRDEGLLEGVAVNADGRREASMGVAIADYDGDDDLDIFVTHDIKESNTLYINENQFGFTDRTSLTGLATPSLPNTGFGTDWLDVENDGDLDILIVNGSVSMIESQIEQAIEVPLRQHNQLMVQEESGLFRLPVGGSAFREHRVSRGLAIGDLDNDGDFDAVISNNDDRLTMYVNRSTLDNGAQAFWLGVELQEIEGRNEIGAELRLLGTFPQLRTIHTDGSYASARDTRRIFGLGTRSTESSIEVTWNDGKKETFEGLEANKYHLLRRTIN